jgi:hypothetical protein
VNSLITHAPSLVAATAGLAAAATTKG